MSYTPFEAPAKSDVHHIIWNLVVTDKLTQLTKEIIEKNKIKHILAILPEKNDFLTLNTDIPDVSFYVMNYGTGHDISINFDEYDDCCKQIDEVAKLNGIRNVLLFCNSGFQRSIPFLTYYLIKYHPNEISNIEKAVDLMIPILDRDNYFLQREMYINNLKILLPLSLH